MKYDEVDIKIIKILQADARTSIAQVAEKLGLSTNAVRLRYERIKNNGLIKKTFLPVFLPQYAQSKSQTYKMQMTIRATNTETPKLLNFIRKLDINHAQIECWETIGHFNVLVWVISEDPIDMHVIQEKIENQVGVIENKACIIAGFRDYYQKLDLNHLVGRRIDG